MKYGLDCIWVIVSILVYWTLNSKTWTGMKVPWFDGGAQPPQLSALRS